MIRLAVIPAAGIGTRLFPITKAIPKVMLPIGHLPLIHHIINELKGAGVKEVVIVTHWKEDVIRWYFEELPKDVAEELRRQRKEHLLERARPPCDVEIHFVHQPKLTGLAGAVLCAEKFLTEDFVVALGDNLLIEDEPGLFVRKMSKIHKDLNSIATFGVSPVEDVTRVGVIAYSREEVREGARVFFVTRVIEKPRPEEAPSNLGVMGRYVFSPELLDYFKRAPVVGGEISETDAFTMASRDGKTVLAVEFEGKWYDIGHVDSYIQAFVDFTSRSRA